jgi:hypothetical protein
MEIFSRNVNSMLVEACWYLRDNGVREDSRNGPVLTSPTPVTLVTFAPWERVLLWPERDANPFFHLMEALWMMAGRNDVEFPTRFNSKFGQFSDDGVTLHGAYGHRWRNHFDGDQIEWVVHTLRIDPTSRRAVIGMWDPQIDMEPRSRDLPCNTHIYFRVINGKLQMTVCNRSNDLIWGACGSNPVHFSILQEYVAASVGVKMGRMIQFTNNLHIYDSVPNRQIYENPVQHQIYPEPMGVDLIAAGNWNTDKWNRNLESFMEDPLGTMPHPEEVFFAKVAQPMYLAWSLRKDGEHEAALAQCEWIEDQAWAQACREWMQRRYDRR